jgi:hypothetical protein
VFWSAVGLFINLVLVLAFEWLRPRQLSYDGLWNARTGVWTAVLLVDNLIVVWWYALSAFRQTATADETFQENWIRQRQDRKPVVLTDYDNAQGKHVIRNVGGGFAVNVYAIFPGEDDDHETCILGSLAAGAERVLRDGEDEQFAKADRQGLRAHVVLAEGVYTRTAQWNPTLNSANEWASISHDVAVADGGRTILEKRSLADYLQLNWDTLRKQLVKFSEEVGPQ